MLLTDRLGVAVLDAHAQRVGTVGDVRLAAPHDPHQQTMTQLLGVIVSPRTRSSYLGYERSDADAPWAARAGGTAVASLRVGYFRDDADNRWPQPAEVTADLPGSRPAPVWWLRCGVPRWCVRCRGCGGGGSR